MRIVGITARIAERQVLHGIYSVAVLDVVIRMVQKIEGLNLERETLPLGQVETAAHCQVDLLGPRFVIRIQTGKRAGAGAVDAQC